jgi:hypothetical protein
MIHQPDIYEIWRGVFWDDFFGVSKRAPVCIVWWGKGDKKIEIYPLQPGPSVQSRLKLLSWHECSFSLHSRICLCLVYDGSSVSSCNAIVLGLRLFMRRQRCASGTYLSGQEPQVRNPMINYVSDLSAPSPQRMPHPHSWRFAEYAAGQSSAGRSSSSGDPRFFSSFGFAPFWRAFTQPYTSSWSTKVATAARRRSSTVFTGLSCERFESNMCICGYDEMFTLTHKHAAESLQCRFRDRNLQSGRSKILRLVTKSVPGMERWCPPFGNWNENNGSVG